MHSAQATERHLATLIDAEVVWHVPMLGEIHGRDRLLEWLGELLAQGFWLTEHDVFGNDDHPCPEGRFQLRAVA